MPLDGNFVRRLFRRDFPVTGTGEVDYEQLYEMERWALASLSGFQDIVRAVMITGDAEAPFGHERV